MIPKMEVINVMGTIMSPFITNGFVVINVMQELCLRLQKSCKLFFN